MTRCFICGNPCLLGRVTCSDDCHERLLGLTRERRKGDWPKISSKFKGKGFDAETEAMLRKAIDIINKNVKEA